MKSSSILIRVAESEKKLFEAKAKESGVSMSEWIRYQLSVASVPVPSVKKEVKEKKDVKKLSIPEEGEVPKCCICPSVDVQYYPQRSRYFCMAHRP